MVSVLLGSTLCSSSCPFLLLLYESLPGWLSFKASPSRLFPLIHRSPNSLPNTASQTAQPRDSMVGVLFLLVWCHHSPPPPLVKCIKASALTLLVTSYLAAGTLMQCSYHLIECHLCLYIYIKEKKNKNRNKNIGGK